MLGRQFKYDMLKMACSWRS